MTATAILIDSREPAHIQQLAFEGLPKIVNALPCGDAWVSTDSGDLVVVERKTPDDLLGSIKDNRIFGQCAAMREQSPWCYVVVTDALQYNHNGKVITDGRVSGWNWSAVQGALLDVQELGVRVLFCQGEMDYEQTVLRLAKRKRSGDRIIEPAQQARLLTSAEQVLTALPGIGIERAQTLLNYFDNRAAEALAWLTWQGTVLTVAGISSGTKTSVRKALGLRADEELFVMTPVDYENAAKRLEDERIAA